MQSDKHSLQPKDTGDNIPTPSVKKALDTARKTTGDGRPSDAIRSGISQMLGKSYVFGFSSTQTDQPKASSSNLSKEISQPASTPYRTHTNLHPREQSSKEHLTTDELTERNTDLNRGFTTYNQNLVNEDWDSRYSSPIRNTYKNSLPLRGDNVPNNTPRTDSHLTKEPKQFEQITKDKPKKRASINDTLNESKFSQHDAPNQISEGKDKGKITDKEALISLNMAMKETIEAFKSLHNEMQLIIRGDNKQQILDSLNKCLEVFTNDYDLEENIEKKRKIHNDFKLLTSESQSTFDTVKKERSNTFPKEP
jgi:hypothetical protein